MPLALEPRAGRRRSQATQGQGKTGPQLHARGGGLARVVVRSRNGARLAHMVALVALPVLAGFEPA